MRQRGIPADLMRAGTSRGLLLAMADLPPAGPQRDELVRELVGSPDPQQMDGVGAGVPSASKVMAVGPSTRPGIDAESLFAEVGVGDSTVGYGGNCGNLSAAVGVWAIDHGLVGLRVPLTEVAVFNLNTGRRLRIAVPCDSDGPAEIGTEHDSGIDRPAAPATVFFQFPPDADLVLGDARRVVTVGEAPFDVTLSMTGSPQIVVRPPAGLIDFDASADALNADADLLALCERLRRGVIDRFPRIATPDGYFAAVPRLAFVEPSAAGVISVRALSMGRFARAMPVTTAVAIAAIVGYRHSTAFVGDGVDGVDEVTLVHPTGEVRCQLVHDDAGRLTEVGLVRTVRRIMSGTVYARALGASHLDDARPSMVGAASV